jgi:tyrosine decarboxylase / aspartate 1-decarboxylase
MLPGSREEKIMEPLTEEEVMRILTKARSRDLDYERVFSTMCTKPHPIAVRAHQMFLETNLGDAGLFPGVVEIEARAIRMIGELLGYPEAMGYISTGGTESNIQGIRAARNASGYRDGNIVVPASAHFSFDKIGDLLHLEVRKAQLDSDLKVDLSSVESQVNDKTVALVGIAGTTEFGQVDPIDGLSKIALDRGIHLHVDAAFGGFVIPFLGREDLKWNFRVKGVSSITIDPHKMGLSTIPAGGLLFRDIKDVMSLQLDTHYLTVAKQASLTGTRCGAAAAATFAVMALLGRPGFETIVKGCMDVTRHLVSGARAIGIMPVIEPVMNVVALRVPKTPEVRSELAKVGWHVSMSREPHRALRIILMPHVTVENVNLFLKDLDSILRGMNKHG